MSLAMNKSSAEAIGRADGGIMESVERMYLTRNNSQVLRYNSPINIVSAHRIDSFIAFPRLLDALNISY